MISQISRFSPAKLNLYLEIKNRRTDGFHNIESLMTFCDYGDLISVKKSKNFKLKIDGPFSNSLNQRENLIEKTVKGLENIYKRKFLVSIDLTKNLPISSGMGGGSSNSATVIKCLKEIFELKEPKDFNEFLLSLGADVPFCYYGKTAIVSGIGEKIEFIGNVKNFYILLINPKTEVSTKEIFDSLKIDSKSKIKNNEKSIKPNNLSFILKKKNDLESHTITINKKINEILSFLKSCKGCLMSRMTGSGATCFAFFNGYDDQEKAKIRAKNKFKNYWIQSSRLINSVQHI